jgi:peptidoglycan/xylan/chitin deacetylase (PgdA/CDA1 family)
VAVTFDDLPMTSMRYELETLRAITAKLIDGIRRSEVPAIGFVNEDKLLTDGKTDPAKVALLRQWPDAGLELGNHTYSHPDLHRVELTEFQQDVLRGERVTRELMRQQGLELRYFRHPFLHTGRSLETKRALEAFLDRHGYRVAPVTHDNSEWIFARAYDRAVDRDDRETMKRIGGSYVEYMEKKFAYFEHQSTELFGREIRQILLVHANRLNGDYFDELARMIRSRGYAFVSLESALEDPAYASEDAYTGPAGITWLHRWALTRGVERSFFAGEPATPRFVMQQAGVESE